MFPNQISGAIIDRIRVTASQMPMDNSEELSPCRRMSRPRRVLVSGLLAVKPTSLPGPWRWQRPLTSPICQAGLLTSPQQMPARPRPVSRRPLSTINFLVCGRGCPEGRPRPEPEPGTRGKADRGNTAAAGEEENEACGGCWISQQPTSFLNFRSFIMSSTL